MQQLVDDIAAAVHAVDRCGVPFKQFQPGAGPNGEPQLTKLITKHLAEHCGDRYVGIKRSVCRTFWSRALGDQVQNRTTFW